ncbi:MAG: S8 family serine peptidase [Proteobacteria bacterium]|nr:S8 family serine peptidase [Pseudomonadota bacterium]
MRTYRYVSAAVSAALSLLAVSNAQAEPAALGSGLREISAAYDGNSTKLPAILKLHLADRTGNPMVRVRLAPGADADAVLAKLAAAGFRLKARSQIMPHLVEGYLPLAKIHEAAAISGIGSLAAIHRPMRNVGLVTSQAVALEKADLAQQNGYDGTGIKLGALSDSFDACTVCSTHAADDVASGDLPAAGVTVLEDAPSGSGEDEGRAMLQLVHDIAPGSQLAFATAFTSEIDFANNILALRSKFGADVIVDDVYYYDEPMFSDGILAQAVNIVNQSGGAYFASAGNNGLEAWEDNYRPISFAKAEKLMASGGGNLQLDQIPPALRPQSFHNFNGTGPVSITQHVTVAGDSVIDLQWDEPFYLGKVQTDYNIYIFDANGNWLDPNTSPTTYNTFDNNIQTDAALELAELLPVPGNIVGGANVGDYQILIGSMNGGPAKHLKYIAENTLAVSERQNAPSIAGHAAASGGIGVAATYYAIPSFPEDFSSSGPVTILFDTQGNRLKAPDVRQVPQLTAADGVDTTFFPPGGSDPDGTGWPNFFGTSAAAPDAAAVAALTLQAAGGSGSLNPRALYQVLEQTATPLPVPNVRSVSGAFAGPVAFAASKDWTRYTGNFSLAIDPSFSAKRSVASITFDTTKPGLSWSANPNRFSVSNGQGVSISDMTWATSPDQTQFTVTFANGAFKPGDSFDFGMSVFAGIQGSTQEDPDRFRGMKITVTMDNGKVFSGVVTAFPKLQFNNFTGYGLVNANRATRTAKRGN